MAFATGIKFLKLYIQLHSYNFYDFRELFALMKMAHVFILKSD